MPQQQSPFLEGKYGWNFGEGGWNTGMDENLLKFSYMFDRNVDGVVASLPSAVNGQAYFLTTDNRFYFAVGTTWYSSPTPKWFEFKVRSNGNVYQFNGTAAVQIDSPAELDDRLDSVELTISSLGSAAFEDSSFFATQSALDVVEANAATYTDDLRNDILSSNGAEQVGYGISTVDSALDATAILVGIDPTGAISIDSILQAALTARDVVVLPAGDFKLSSKITLKSGNVLRGQGIGATRIFRDTAVAAFDFFEGITVEGITVEGIHFDSVSKLPVTVAANRHCALRFWDNDTNNRSKRIAIRNCRFDKFTSAEIQSEGARGVIAVDQCDEVMIHNNRFYDNRATCVFYFDSKSIQVVDNYCQGEQVPYDLVFQPTQGLGSFVSGGGEGHTIALNRIYETGYSSINAGGVGVQVVGNTIENPSYSGIGVNESHSIAARGVNIVGNSIRGAKLAGIYLWNVADFTVTGNVVEACGITNTSGGIRLQDATGGAPTNGIISGNHVRANYGAGLRVHSGTKISITGNRITESTGSGISCLSQSATYTTEITVNGNTFIDNSVYAIDTPTTNLSACTVSVDGNTIISSNIGTLQATGFVMNGPSSVWNLGSNTFSANYDTSRVETSFASRATKAFLQINSATANRMKVVAALNYIGTATYDPASLADGAGVTTTVAVTGAALGDMARASFSLDLQGVLMQAWVSAPNVVSIRFQNETGGVVDLASGTITAQVIKL